MSLLCSEVVPFLEGPLSEVSLYSLFDHLLQNKSQVGTFEGLAPQLILGISAEGARGVPAKSCGRGRVRGWRG